MKKDEQKVRKIKDVTKLTGMIRGENKLAIWVEVRRRVEALNLKGFEYVRLFGKFDLRMMIYNKCTRIESQREKIKLEIWNW